MESAVKKRPRSKLEHGCLDYGCLFSMQRYHHRAACLRHRPLPKTNRPRLLRTRAVLVRLLDHPCAIIASASKSKSPASVENASGFGSFVRSSLAQSSHLLPKTNRPRLLRARAVLVRLLDHPLRDHRICHQKQIARVC